MARGISIHTNLELRKSLLSPKQRRQMNQKFWKTRLARKVRRNLKNRAALPETPARRRS